MVAILTAVIHVLLTFVATALAAIAQQRLPGRRRWRLHDPSHAVICISTSASIDTGEYMRHTSGVGQAIALGMVAASLHKAYPGRSPQHVHLSEEPLADRLESDLILLGGPKNNKVTRMMLAALQTRLPVSVLDRTFVWSTGATELRYLGQSRKQSVYTDYGLVIHVRNPKKPATTLVMLIGCHTYGVVAAARYFLEEYSPPLTKRKSSFVAIVEAEVNDGHVGVPRLLHKVEIRD